MRCAAAGEHDRPFRKSQMDAAIRFCGKAFGQDYAALLAKAAEMADSRRTQGGGEGVRIGPSPGCGAAAAMM